MSYAAPLYKPTAQPVVQPAAQKNEVREIDLTISHERKLTAEEKLAYEELFRVFADNVYEMSNGVHKLRNIVIFDGGRYSDSTDIVFSQSTTRSNAIANNYGKDKLSRAGMSIEDRLGQPPVSEATIKSLAGTLAHEFGHYFYGALDEYIENGRGLDPYNPGSPSGIDTPPDPCSLMSGCYSTYEGVNFSTKKSTADVGKTQNAHYRVYKASAWETLVRNPKDDPLVTRFNEYTGPEQVPSDRLYWPELAGKAPPADQFRTVELPAAQDEARSVRNITWADDSVTDNRYRFFLVDVSKNMGEKERLESTKTALKAYVDRAKVNDQIGIITFADTEIQPLTKIVDDNTKEDIKNAIDGIQLSSVANQRIVSTADKKAIDALAAANSFGLVADRAVYVIINGAFTEPGVGGGFNGTGFEKVSNAHGNAGIPISIFNFNDCSQPGDFWPGCSAGRGTSISVLRGVVGATANKPGVYKYIGQGPFELPLRTTVTTAATNADNADPEELVDAMSFGDEELSPRLDVNLGTGRDLQLQLEQPFTTTFFVDHTLDQIEANFSFNGAPTGVQLNLTDPNGQPLLNSPTCESDGTDSVCKVTISAPLTGTWEISAQAVTQTLTFGYEATGVALEGATYQASLTSPASDFVAYPDPVVLGVSLSNINPIARTGVTAWVEGPDGTFSDVTLKDDGNLPDLYPDDGLYSGLLPYNQSGYYHVTALFNNIAGNAFYTTAGLEDGDLVTTTVGADFDRFAEYEVFVGGFTNDDHGNDSADATSLSGDNEEAYGRLDNPTDVDVFHVVSLTVPSNINQTGVQAASPAASSSYVLRLGSLTNGLDPKVTVITPNGSKEYTPGAMNYSHYFTATVDVTSGEPITVEIAQHTAQSPAGNYALSFGAPHVNEIVSAPLQTLTVNKTGAGAGTVTSSPAGINCGATCAASFAQGAIVTLTATVNADATFGGWSGGCTGASPSCEVTLDAAKTVTANFALVPTNTNTNVYLPVVQK